MAISGHSFQALTTWFELDPEGYAGSPWGPGVGFPEWASPRTGLFHGKSSENWFFMENLVGFIPKKWLI